jgi:hypothetical protein
MVKVKKDLTGKLFGMLTVIRQDEEDYVSPQGKHKAKWICECSCEQHNMVSVVGTSLTQKNGTRSCGCLAIQQTINRNKDCKKTNIYDLSGEYGVGWTFNTNQEFYFDLEDYNQIKDICWYEVIRHGVHSLEGQNCSTGITTSMHILLGYKYYDHIDRNELNNRKCNLRPASNSEQCQNRSKFKNNTSGVTGVHYDKNKNKYIARIQVNNKRIVIGNYDNKYDAIKARLTAEQKYFGEFAPQKHLYEQYMITQQNNNEVQ